MDKEKEKVSSHRASSGSGNAKKVVSKKASSNYRPVTDELSNRSSSAGRKRTSNSVRSSSARKSTKKKRSKKKNTPKIFQNLPATARFLLKIICVLVVLILIVTIWTSVSGWTLSDLLGHGCQSVRDWSALSGSGEDFPITLSGSHSIKQEKLGSGIAVLTDTSLSIYSKKGNTARTQAHYMANPGLAAESNYAVVYDIGGDRWRLETASETLCTGESESTILSACASRSGYFALVCTDDERHSAVLVYDRSGKKIFGWKSADYYITTAALSSNGEKLVVCGFNAENGIMKSTAITFDVFDSKEISREFFADTLLLDVRYLKSGKAIMVGDNSIITVSENGRKFDTRSLNENVIAYDFDYSSGVVYCTSPIEGSQIISLVALDTNGNERFTEKISCAVTDAAISSEYVCVLSQGFTASYTIGGKLIEESEIAVDAKKIIIIKDKAYILCNSVLRRASVN